MASGASLRLTAGTHIELTIEDAGAVLVAIRRETCVNLIRPCPYS
jgi:hypothetical protein